MLKNELINKIQEKLTGKTKKECGEFIDAFVESITNALAKGDEVKIQNFGTFKLRNIKGHETINPATKERITVKDMFVPFFQVSNSFKDSVMR